jgi:cell division protein ZapA (FtsZ GTPase activity inhibitor)
VNGSMPESSKSAVALSDLLIDVLGTRFSITTNEDPAFLDKVLAQYQAAIENTRNISGMKDSLKIAILTGFLLCAEINKLKTQIEREQTGVEQELNRITRNLIDCIDHAIDHAMEQTTILKINE